MSKENFLSFLVLGKAINAVTWHLSRTTYQSGKTTEIAPEMRNHNLLGISETRWTQSGRKRLNSREILLSIQTMTRKTVVIPLARSGPDVVKDSTEDTHRKREAEGLRNITVEKLT